MEVYAVLYEEGKDEGVYALSVVEDPAMEGMFIALKKDDKQEIKLAEVNKEQRILMGLALQPDKPVYRNQGGKEFYITFPRETIKAAAHGFLKNGHQRNSSIEHETKLSGVSVVESWIIEDKENDKSKAFGFDYPEGSWMVSMKVDNDELWQDFVKTGKVKGFSIDGLFSMEQLNLNNVSDNKLLDAFNDFKEDIKALFKKEVKLGSMMLADMKTKIEFEGENIVKGSNLFMLSDDGDRIPLPDGDHELESGMEVSVKDGAVDTIQEKSEEGDTGMIEKLKEVMAQFKKETTEEIQSLKTDNEKLIAKKDKEIEELKAELSKVETGEEIKKKDREFDANIQLNGTGRILTALRKAQNN